MKGVSTRAEIADLIARTGAVGGGHLIEMLRPVMKGELSLIAPTRETRMPPLHRIGLLGKPIVVLVGDDDYASTGPAGWASAAKLREWASYAVVHGAGARAEHYAMGAALAAQTGRLLFVETSSAATDDWGLFLNKRPGLPIFGILCRDSAHPVPLKAGDLH